MPKVAQITDLNGQPLYINHNTKIIPRRCKAWYVSDHYVVSSMADQFYVKKCSSKQAAVNWATSKRRIKEFGENAEFYITHA